ncbi:MAG: glycosyltransferase family 4 protein [Gemmatimonadetes bacterium]|nr:glycosyltransferase family 4 protein [Gemmatimonadota bacterium]
MARETVIIVTDRYLFPCREGHQARIIELVRALQARGIRVVLVGPRIPWRILPRLPGPRYMLQTWLFADDFVPVDGARFASGSPTTSDYIPYAAALERAVARHQPIAIIAEYLWMAPCLDVVNDGTLRLLDTHDVMHLRREMYAGQPEGAWVECSRQEEIDLLARADVILAIQQHEQRLFGEMLPEKRVICVPHTMKLPRHPARDTPGEVVAFVGSPIQGNLLGIHSFIEQAWPRVQCSRPRAELRIYGGVAERVEIAAAGVQRVGRVRDLGKVYGTAQVVINPVTLGTGLKIKTVEALAHGKAVVTTSCGAAGIEEGAGSAFLLEDDMKAFGSTVAELLSDRSRRRTLGFAAHRFAHERFGREAVLKELIAVLRPQAVPEMPVLAAH